MKRIIPFFLPFLFFIQYTNSQTVTLEGTWRFQMDPDDLGIDEKWFTQVLSDTIHLPGSMPAQGKGYAPSLSTQWTGSIYDSSWFFNPAMAKYREPGNLKFPFWLTPNKVYVGTAWYQREIDIPEDWKDRSIILFLERPHWQTMVWLDDQLIGSANSLSTPHQFEIAGSSVKPGKHTLTISVNNTLNLVDPGINSHSVSDHTQGNWNGIVGRMEIRAKNNASISQVTIFPKVKEKLVEVKVQVQGIDNLNTYEIFVTAKGLNHSQIMKPFTIQFPDTSINIVINYPMGEDFKTWDEFSPMLYELLVELRNKTGTFDMKTLPFGMRDFSIEGSRFYVNNREVFLRGTTDCSVYPHTGYPPVDESEWMRVFSICKSFGLNHMRFHSYCPPEAAFMAADKAGIYLQVEGPSWAKYSTSLGDGKPIDAYLYAETKRIIDTYGHHPSFCMMAYGNEPSGHYVEYLTGWVDHFKMYDPQHVFCGASTGRSWSIIPNSDFIVRSPPRGLEWNKEQPNSTFDYRDKMENQIRPYITFEMGQWCAFPNFDEIDKYTGHLKAKNFELFQEELIDKHMGDQAHDFLMASGKLQASCYKQEIEATLRTPGLAGFQLLSLNDFSGQGTALVGVLDAFWDEKGYISSSEFSRFCNTVVPLARFPKFVYSNADTLNVRLEAANFSEQAIENSVIVYKITDQQGTVIETSKLKDISLTVGNCNGIGYVVFPLKEIDHAQQLKLEVSIDEYTNSWNFWVYPTNLKVINTDDIYVTYELNEKAKESLEQGGKVLLLCAGKVEHGKDVVQYFTPVFWNTSWFRMRPPHTTGILIKNENPVFKNFPTQYYSDLQWWEISNRQQVMNLEDFPPDFRPIVQPIDTWFLNRRLGMLFEAKVDKGKLMVCSIDLQNDLDKRIVARQLLYSIEKYIISDDFNPQQSVNLEDVEELFEVKERPGWNSYVKENP
ncbi:MAG: beta-glucuronidase [Bacteroidales bacterium]|nr:beta-glucuronidase [Bacteroidales bacterium]